MTLDEFLDEWNSPADTLLVHTSGSTGKPKPMRVEKRRMLNSARITCDFLSLHPGDTALLCMPLDYIAGKMMVVRSIERHLQLVSVPPSGHPLCGVDEPITFAAMVPLQVYNSLQTPEERKKLRNIHHLIIGGGAVDDSLQQQLADFPNAVWSTYGMTETLSHIALRRLNGPSASLWYTPFNGVEVDLNAEGCLVINAPLVHEGLLQTNDIAEIDGRCFRIKGRRDNVIDTGGIKVQIEEVEQMLRPHMPAPFVITKRGDAKYGDMIVLLTEMTDEAEADRICKNVLPKYWQPRCVKHVDAIPVTQTGKPARAEAERLAAELL